MGLEFIIIASITVNSIMDECQDNYRYWDYLSPVERSIVLASEKIDSVALMYYYESFSPSDNDTTFYLLDVLTNAKTEQEKCLYFWLFNRILSSSDGALAEVLGPYCLKWILSDSEYVCRHLYKYPDLEQEYSLKIAYSLMSEDPYSFNELKKKLEGIISGRFLSIYLTSFLRKLESDMILLKE